MRISILILGVRGLMSVLAQEKEGLVYPNDVHSAEAQHYSQQMINKKAIDHLSTQCHVPPTSIYNIDSTAYLTLKGFVSIVTTLPPREKKQAIHSLGTYAVWIGFGYLRKPGKFQMIHCCYKNSDCDNETLQPTPLSIKIKDDTSKIGICGFE